MAARSRRRGASRLWGLGALVATPTVTTAGARIAAATIASAKTCVPGPHAAVGSRADCPATATSAVAPARDDYYRD
jgi:hypothetical protein